MDYLADKNKYFLNLVLIQLRIEILKKKFGHAAVKEYSLAKSKQAIKEYQKINKDFKVTISGSGAIDREIQVSDEQLCAAKTPEDLLALAQRWNIKIPDSKIEEMKRNAEKLTEQFFKKVPRAKRV